MPATEVWLVRSLGGRAAIVASDIGDSIVRHPSGGNASIDPTDWSGYFDRIFQLIARFCDRVALTPDRGAGHTG
jgi:hypothetical protein